MEKIFSGVVMGGLVGAGVGFVSKVIDDHKKEVNNLDYDWRYIKVDPPLTQAIFNIKKFKQVDEEAYYKIGEACNNIVSLWFTINDKNTKHQHHWPYKSFTYRQDVEKMLTRMSKYIIESNKRKKMNKSNGTQPSKISFSMQEFGECADALCGIIQNYHFNIMQEMQFKYDTSRFDSEYNESQNIAQ